MRNEGRRYQLLVVDDDAVDRRLYRKLLAQQWPSRCAITEVRDATSALAAVRNHKFDCVLLDFKLPDMTGLEFLDAAASEGEPPYAVVLITGKGDESIAVEAMKHGAHDYLIKDNVNASSLCRAIANAVTQTELRQHLDYSLRRLIAADAALQKANRAKSHFLAGMSHELRTPLNVILGYAHLLIMEGDLNPTQVARVGAMQTAGQHLLQMIDCVIDLSEIETGRAAVQLVETDVQAIVTACLDLVRPVTASKGLALDLAVKPGARQQVVTDPMRLRQVLFNLIANAAKFTSQGSIQLRVQDLVDGSALRIEVADTGPGISADQRQRLFQDFERLDAPGEVKGAGLGLALSARLVTLMGARLGHDANPGGGSVFWLELPTNDAARSVPSSAAPNDVPAPTSIPTDALAVLVVDDVLMNRDIAGSFLRAAGYNVTCVGDGAAAVQAAGTTDFDVILMDVRMPEMDGLEATRRIRALDGSRGQVPIVALTAQAFTEQIGKCLEAGMDGHLAKPFTPDALVSTVVRAAQVGRPRSEPCNASPTSVGSDAKPLIGAELLVLDSSAFDRTAGFLSPEAVAGYLQTIANSAQTLLCDLRKMDALTCDGDRLADAAHTLAGSAGLLGFQRLAALGRRFEQASQSAAPDKPAITTALCAAIEVTLQAIRDRSAAAVKTEEHVALAG
jgi:signal transduction histidine kinase/HPt (histidine-containing phosphotransfer) domain-containing protein